MRPLPVPLVLPAFALVALVACGEVEVLREVSESDAHRAVSALARAGVGAHVDHTGPQYRVRVDERTVPRAVEALRDESLPRTQQPGFEASWGPRALTASEPEERARAAQAVAGELARTLQAIDGVLDARVHVAPAVPDDDPARALRASASVVIRHRGATPPLDASQVRATVAGAVTAMRRDDVNVLFLPALRRSPTPDLRVTVFGVRVLPEGVARFAEVLLVAVAVLGASLARVVWEQRRRGAR